LRRHPGTAELEEQFVKEQQNSNHAYYASALKLIEKQLRGSQKYTCSPLSIVIFACCVVLAPVDRRPVQLLSQSLRPQIDESAALDRSSHRFRF